MAIVLAAGAGYALAANIEPAERAKITWRQLHRPLHLPAVAPGDPCPVSSVDERVDWESTGIFGGSGTGRGPAYPGLGGSDGKVYVSPPREDGWYGGKVFWYVKPEYRGKVLVRGTRLDGPGALNFSEGRRRTPELRIGPSDSVQWSGRPDGSRGVPSGTWFQAPGCFGYQVDGRGFSRVVVFSGVVE